MDDHTLLPESEEDVHFKHAPDIPTDLVVTIGIVGAIVLLITIVGTQAWFYSAYEEAFQEKRVEVQNEWLRNAEQEQLQLLNSEGWTNKSEGRVRIPIEDAIGRYVADYESGATATGTGTGTGIGTGTGTGSGSDSDGSAGGE